MLLDTNSTTDSQAIVPVTVWQKITPFNFPIEEAMLQLKQGIEKFKQGEVYEGLALVKQLIESHPDSAQAHSTYGFFCFAIKDYEGAIASHSSALALDPTLASSYGGRGLAYYELGNKGQALVDLNQSIQLDPQLGNSFYCRGKFYLEQKQFSKAFQDFKIAAELMQNEPLSPSIEQNLNTIQVHFRQGLEEKASTAGDLVDNAREMLSLNRLYDAMSLLKQATQKDNRLAVAYYLQGSIHMSLNRYQEALQAFDQGISRNSYHADIYYDRSCLHFDQQQFELAIEDCQRALKLDPWLPQAYYNIGSAYLGLGNREYAIANLEQSAQLFGKLGQPDHAQKVVMHLMMIHNGDI